MSNVSPTTILALGTRSTTAGDTSTITGVTSGTSRPIDVRGFEKIAVYFQSVGTTSGGTLLIEEACWDPNQDPIYSSGTWSQVASQAASGFTGTVQLGYHLTVAAYAFLRIRISSAITGGGTVIVWVVGA